MKNLFCILLIFVFASCEKDDPTPEPPGSNVKSYSVTILSTEWNFSNNHAYVGHAMPQINAEVFSKGTVNVFLYAGNNNYFALPLLLPFNSDKEYEYSFSISDGYINFSISFSDGSNLSSITADLTYKVVIISGQ